MSSAPPEPEEHAGLRKVSRASSFISRTRTFRKLCKWAFGKMDRNRSGFIQKEELYTGVLMIHLQCAKYVGPAACRPPSQDVVEMIFDRMDDNQSGQIDEEEFVEIMVVLTSNMAARIFVQYALVILLFPQMSAYVTNQMILPLIDFIFPGDQSDLGKVLHWMPPTVPKTMVATVLYMVAIPALLDFVDKYFLAVAVEANTMNSAEENKILNANQAKEE